MKPQTYQRARERPDRQGISDTRVCKQGNTSLRSAWFRHRLANDRSRLARRHPNNHGVGGLSRTAWNRTPRQVLETAVLQRQNHSKPRAQECAAWAIGPGQDHAGVRLRHTSQRYKAANRGGVFRIATIVDRVSQACLLRVSSQNTEQPLPARSHNRCSAEFRFTTRLARICIRSGVDCSPPASIAPRQIPAAIRRHDTRHQIKPLRASRVAAAEPRQRHPTAGPQSKSCDGLVGIVRTRRQVPAMHADQR